MTAAEERLTGARLDDDTIAAAAELCQAGAKPLPETDYKVELIAATVTEALERLRATLG